MSSRLPIVAGPSTAPENIDAHFIGATAVFVLLHLGSSARARLVCRLTKNASSCGPPSSSSGYGSGVKVASVPARGCQALVLCSRGGAGVALLGVLAPPSASATCQELSLLPERDRAFWWVPEGDRASCALLFPALLPFAFSAANSRAFCSTASFEMPLSDQNSMLCE